MIEDLRIERDRSILRRQVEDTLRRAIASGRFPPGARITERELCDLLDVSRTSVREAVQRLLAEGLIVHSSHRGLSIAKLSHADAKQIYEVRQKLEPIVVRDFTQRASDDAVRQLRCTLVRLRQAADAEDRVGLLEGKTAFYSILTSGSGNNVVARILTLLHNQVSLLRVTSMLAPGRMRASLEELGKIIDAIEARDAARAAKAAEDHIKAAARIALGILKMQESQKEHGTDDAR